MKCEICGKPTEPKMCDWLTNVMCPEHAKQVKDYIERLKPKPRWRAERTQYGYVLWERSQEGPWDEETSQYGMPKDAADALYEHMRRERGQD